MTQYSIGQGICFRLGIPAAILNSKWYRKALELPLSHVCYRL